eukprot:CAMPEP_0170195672 /NCGR_PEP_ID=MMETSP0040_2-20121228/61949_1 /TAXON_ID=641309 /ORGANISM="Lotharella oceanica, Strain CCMP622" /LENGTH=97 /DNA_ID=CAMNT_0010444885 /DNA_START=13 /DNA_END=306 /DNA_ORIENTATION=-
MQRSIAWAVVVLAGQLKWFVFCAVAMVKFVLELDPVQPQRVQEALQKVHAQQHAEGCERPHRKANDQKHGVIRLQTPFDEFLPKNFSQLRVRERQSP